MKKKVFLFGLIISFAACQTTDVKQRSPTAIDTLAKNSVKVEETTQAETEEVTESKLLNILSKLPEYQKVEKYIDSISSGKKGVATMIDKPGEEESGYYKVSVGYNGDARFETYHLFYVNPKTSDIKIMDDVSGEVVSMETWRKRQAENTTIDHEG